jgi:hypothetical protein
VARTDEGYFYKIFVAGHYRQRQKPLAAKETCFRLFFLIEERRQGINRFPSPTTVKEPDRLAWRIQHAGGFAQEPGEAISRLRVT